MNTTILQLVAVSYIFLLIVILLCSWLYVYIDIYMLQLCIIAILKSLMAEVRWKTELPLCLPWWHVGGLDVHIHLFLTSALDGNEWSTSLTNLYKYGGKIHYPFNRRLVDPLSWPGHSVKGQNFIPTWNWTKNHPVFSLLSTQCTPSQLLYAWWVQKFR